MKIYGLTVPDNLVVSALLYEDLVILYFSPFSTCLPYRRFVKGPGNCLETA